jgi:hypothetical protein
MRKDEYEAIAESLISQIKSKGGDNNKIGMKLIKSGFVADFKLAEQADYKKVLCALADMLDGLANA